MAPEMIRQSTVHTYFSCRLLAIAACIIHFAAAAQTINPLPQARHPFIGPSRRSYCLVERTTTKVILNII
jgi:hypothetical protein